MWASVPYCYNIPPGVLLAVFELSELTTCRSMVESESNMRVVVVGGVAGGMSAAARLRRRDEGAEIIVLERSKYVSFANCGLPYYVGGEIEDPAKLLLHTPHTLKAALNLDVRINSEVTAIDPGAHSVQVTNTETGEDYTLTYDYLILSPGGLASRPLIEGLGSPRVHTLRTVDDALARPARGLGNTSRCPRRRVHRHRGRRGPRATRLRNPPR